MKITNSYISEPSAFQGYPQAVSPDQTAPSKSQFPTKKPAGLWQKISKVASIIFKAILTVFLYWINPSIFALGFVIGIVADEQSRKGIEKISKVWRSQPWSMCLIGGAAAFLSLPITTAAGTFLLGSLPRLQPL